MMRMLPAGSLSLDVFRAAPVSTPCESIRIDLDPFFVPKWMTFVQPKYIEDDKGN